MTDTIKTDLYGAEAAQRLFKAYASESLVTFRETALNMIEKNTCSSKDKKAYFSAQVRQMKNKDRILTLMTNIQLSGEGLKVA